MEYCVGFVLKQHEGYLLRHSAQHCQSSLHDSSVFQPISPLTRDFPARLPEKEDRLKTRAMGSNPFLFASKGYYMLQLPAILYILFQA
jgi:hypothetical protein